MGEPYTPPHLSREHSLASGDDDEGAAAFAAPRLVQPSYALGHGAPEYAEHYVDYAGSVPPPPQPPREDYREAGGYAGDGGYGASSDTFQQPGMEGGYGASSVTFQQPSFQPQPPARAQLGNDMGDDVEMAEMVQTIESFAYIPALCAACGPLITVLISWALGGAAWKTGVLSGDFVSVGLRTVTIYGDAAAPPESSGLPLALSALCEAPSSQLSACRLGAVGTAVRVLLTLALLASLASTAASAALVLLDASRLGSLRAQLGHTGVAALPRIASLCWFSTAALLGFAAFVYSALSPFRFRETTLVLDSSFGLLRLAFLLSVIAGFVYSTYLRKVRPMVVSGTFAAAAEHGAVAERPLEVELGLELVRACRLLVERSNTLALLLGVQVLFVHFGGAAGVCDSCAAMVRPPRLCRRLGHCLRTAPPRQLLCRRLRSLSRARHP
mmetsp:Transcript_11919/g.28152  ORF Transcript_11919/g.28152 Transcript_11919/m.28152 type:complete len:442 (-) Transcript_11919:271-1596(-)